MKKHKWYYIIGLICITLAPISAAFCFKSDWEIYQKEMKYQIETFGYYKKDIICLQEYEQIRKFNSIWEGIMILITIGWLVTLLIMFINDTTKKELKL